MHAKTHAAPLSSTSVARAVGNEAHAD